MTAAARPSQRAAAMGRLQRSHSVTHVIAGQIGEIAPMLDLLAEQGRDNDPAFAPVQDLG